VIHKRRFSTFIYGNIGKHNAMREAPALHFSWELHPRPQLCSKYHYIITDTFISYRNRPIQTGSWKPVPWELSWELALKNALKIPHFGAETGNMFQYGTK